MSRLLARKASARMARGARVDEILQAARSVFCEKGYDHAAVAEIAARIDVVEGTIYKYFESKRELLLKVLEHWYEEMFGDYARDLAGVTGVRARLRLLVWRHLRSIRDNPALCRLMFREVRSELAYRGSGLHAMNRRYTQFLTGVLEQGVRDGELRADAPIALLRDLVYGGIEHHAWSYLCGRGELDIGTIADQIATLVCDGVQLRHEPVELQRQAARLSKIATRIERSFAGGARASRLKPARATR